MSVPQLGHDKKLGMLSMDLLALAAAPKFRDLVTPSILPARKAQIQWNLACQQPFAMDGNDQYGDCFWAMATHMVQIWTANAGQEFVPTEADTLAAYSACTGFDPNDPNSDQGTEPSVGLKYLQNVGIAGKKFGPWVSIRVDDPDEIALAIDLFGGVALGVSVPQDWEQGHCWDVSSAQIVGGHAIPGYGHDIDMGFSKKGVPLVTWGSDQYMITWDALRANGQLVAGIVSPLWIADNNLAPSGFDIQKLMTFQSNPAI